MSAPHRYATTNARIDDALAIVVELIEWAKSDATHATENGAMRIALDDRQRVMQLALARYWLARAQRT